MPSAQARWSIMVQFQLLAADCDEIAFQGVMPRRMMTAFPKCAPAPRANALGAVDLPVTIVATIRERDMRLVGFIAIGMLCGCGAPGTPAAPIDDNTIRTLVGHVAEYHANPKAFGVLFAEGAVPNEATRTKLRGMMTKVERARVDDTGSTATVDVVYEVLQTGQIQGPVQWKLAKSGDQWKVSTFALPGEAVASP